MLNNKGLLRRVKGLQNLYSSVRSRPAPHTPSIENTPFTLYCAWISRACPNAPTTGKNGEHTAKRGAPSRFRPGRVDFRPDLRG